MAGSFQTLSIIRKRRIHVQYAIAHLDPNEDNPSMEENPCINVDFENEEESCLEAATMMMDEGYKMVTPFFIEDGGKAGTYSWEYVNAHLVVRTK